MRIAENSFVEKASLRAKCLRSRNQRERCYTIDKIGEQSWTGGFTLLQHSFCSTRRGVAFLAYPSGKKIASHFGLNIKEWRAEHVILPMPTLSILSCDNANSSLKSRMTWMSWVCLVPSRFLVMQSGSLSRRFVSYKLTSPEMKNVKRSFIEPFHD